MDHTRRTFVLASAALLQAQSPNDTVRVAFIGVGNRGGYLLNTMLKVFGVKVVAICDIDFFKGQMCVQRSATTLRMRIPSSTAQRY
jgi:predicted homoserine dehydrogenase-like protein